MPNNMEKIILELIKDVEIWEINYSQAGVNSDFEIIVTYELYKLLQVNNKLYLYEPYAYGKKFFMGHNLRVIADADLGGYNFWIADRKEISNADEM